MKFIKILLIVALLIVVAANSSVFIFPIAKITMRAVDSDGNPIDNATVTASYDFPKGMGMGWGTATKYVDGRTDKDGYFTITHKAAGICNFSVRKEGFYGSSDSYTFNSRILFIWSPWNPTMEIKLKRKKNPTKMYAKSINNMNAKKVPALDTPIGYDLEIGDWVAPYGKGVISDFVFIFKVRFLKNDDWDVSYTLTFSNEHDGIQEWIIPKGNQSVFFWPYEAPEDGYKKEIKWSSYHHPGGWAGVHKSDYKEDRKYIFRVRTKTDEKGNIVEARYGKIPGDIRLFSTGEITFTYYFNPTGSRSLEFVGNLFKFSRKEWEYKVSRP